MWITITIEYPYFYYMWTTSVKFVQNVQKTEFSVEMWITFKMIGFIIVKF